MVGLEFAGGGEISAIELRNSGQIYITFNHIIYILSINILYIILIEVFFYEI